MATAPTFASMAGEYRRLWQGASIKPARQTVVDAAARRILQSKARYQAVERTTGVPWFWIALTHMRESNNDFRGVLHNGQKIIGTGRLTTIVPKGRGPFDTWEQAAADAIKLKKLDAITDWSLERMAYEFERYNGWGYHWKGLRSPYLWGATNQQQPGKYVADGKFDRNHYDEQLGTMAVLIQLAAQDREVATRTGANGVVPAKPLPVELTDGPMSGRYNAVTERVQGRLKALGFHQVGMVDGKWGPNTRGAIAAFMLARGVPGEPDIDEALEAELQQAEGEGWTKPIDPARANATVNELAEKKPEIKQAQNASFWSKLMGWFSATGITGTALVSNIAPAREIVNPIREWFGDAGPWVAGGGALVGVIVVSVLLAKKAADSANASVDASAEAFREGRSND